MLGATHSRVTTKAAHETAKITYKHQVKPDTQKLHSQSVQILKTHTKMKELSIFVKSYKCSACHAILDLMECQILSPDLHLHAIKLHNQSEKIIA
jgi:hypothetical protein